MRVNESQDPNCALGGKFRDFWLSSKNIVTRLISYAVPGRQKSKCVNSLPKVAVCTCACPRARVFSSGFRKAVFISKPHLHQHLCVFFVPLTSECRKNEHWHIHCSLVCSSLCYANVSNRLTDRHTKKNGRKNNTDI